jgi:hypothetical protein
MNPTDADHWKSEVLDEIFIALAASNEIDQALVFKGARVLSLRLGAGRQSLDLDANLTQDWDRQHPDRDAQRAFLENEMTLAIRRYFERQEPVRYELTALRVSKNPPKTHRMGWDAFKVRININDLRKSVRGLPAVEIDVAAPEQLMGTSISRIPVGAHEVSAYTLERIAGEKLRAFLSSLPTYRAKVHKPGEIVRAKDLYDIARIRRVQTLSNPEFWRVAGQEFRIACQSRYIDCQGMATFQEQWEVTRDTYNAATIPKDVPFEEAESALTDIVNFFAAQGFIPFTFPLP